MKRLIIVVVLACLGSAPVRADDLAEHPEVSSQIKLMDAWIQAQMKNIELPGLVTSTLR